ncbi:beta strand repeat-containing protein [Psychroserpens mesophilus]|uniref:beta strand repeat-containing protein n=1 Tax=Psychroserpens mesophilus TaxID=325473 RepID=UPI00058E96ED|nr:hypothetical protein [Psychroserpens mesophilus]
MKTKILYTLTLVVFLQISHAQVGVGTTDPKASLDVASSSLTNPTHTDGLLIPKIDNFPSTNPGTDQDGMMVYVTGNGVPAKGFYYWDNGSSSWLSVKGVEKINDLIDAKSDNDGSFNGASIFFGIGSGLVDDGTNNFNNAIGFQALTSNTSGNNNTAIGAQSLFTNQTGNSNIALGFQALFNNTSGNDNIALGTNSLRANQTGFQNTAIGVRSLRQNTSFSNTVVGSSALENNVTGNSNVALGASAGANSIAGFANVFIGTNSGIGNLGSGNVMIGYQSGLSEMGSNKLYIENSSANSDNALIYGDFGADLLRVNGQFQIGNPTTTGFILPTTDGAVGQILTTDGAGNVSFQNATVNTDDQDLQAPTLTGTTLNLNIENGTGTSIDLSALQDGVGTDDQNIQNLSLNGSNILTVGIENGTADTVDLSALNQSVAVANNTTTITNHIANDADTVIGNEIITAAGLSGTTLQITEAGNITNVDLSTLQDGTGTDNQNLTAATLTGTTLNLGIQNGTGTSVNLASLQDGTGTDNQNLSTATLTGTTLNLGIQNGTGTSVNLASLTDDNDWVTVGANIERQNGDVYIGNTNTTNNDLHISNNIIDWDNTNYYLNPDELSVVDEIQFDSGTETDPSIRFQSTNTGFFSPSNAVTAYSANGTESFRIQNDGEISIGLTAPSDYKFSLSSLSNLNEIRIGNNTTSTNDFIDINHNSQRGNAIDISVDNSYTLASRSGIAVFNELGDTSVNIGKYLTGSYSIYGVEVRIPEDLTGIEYGIYSNVSTTNGYAGYFIGRTSFGNTSSNRYTMPASDGTIGQVLTTDGIGNTSWQNLPSASLSLARITMSADQSFTTSSWQKLNFDTVDFDLNSEFNTTTDEFDVNSTGYYRINASWRSTNTSTSTNAFGIAIVVNGVFEGAVNFNNSGSGYVFRSINRILDLNAGDSVEIQILNTGPIDVFSNDIVTSFEIEQIR